MKRSISSALALLAAAALVVGARSASAGPLPLGCFNPWTGDCYCNAQQALGLTGSSGFINHVLFFQSTGQINATQAACLISAAANLTSAAKVLAPPGNTLGVTGAQFLLQSVTFLLGGSPDTGPFLPLLVPTCIASAMDPVCPVLSNCFIRFSCPGDGNAFTGTMCDGATPTVGSCEASRRVVSRTLGFDLSCAIQLAAGGSFSAPTMCVCP
jgi:hypothetical protein